MYNNNSQQRLCLLLLLFYLFLVLMPPSSFARLAVEESGLTPSTRRGRRLEAALETGAFPAAATAPCCCFTALAGEFSPASSSRGRTSGQRPRPRPPTLLDVFDLVADAAQAAAAFHCVCWRRCCCSCQRRRSPHASLLVSGSHIVLPLVQAGVLVVLHGVQTVLPLRGTRLLLLLPLLDGLAQLARVGPSGLGPSGAVDGVRPQLLLQLLRPLRPHALEVVQPLTLLHRRVQHALQSLHLRARSRGRRWFAA